MLPIFVKVILSVILLSIEIPDDNRLICISFTELFIIFFVHVKRRQSYGLLFLLLILLSMVIFIIFFFRRVVIHRVKWANPSEIVFPADRNTRAGTVLNVIRMSSSLIKIIRRDV
jgi:hypothetical protein